jgi:tRNA1Val (adenine37-N6)-methyltransferase
MFLYQPTSGYCYNSDSIFLYHFAAAFSPRGRLLDVGCGVGILSLLLGRDFGLRITVIDKQKEMVAYAVRNFRLNHLKVEAVHGDFLVWQSSERFDMIVSNPPFYGSGVTQSEDPRLNIARYARHLPLEGFIHQVAKCLKPRGRFVFCYDARQVDQVLATLRAHKLNPEVLRFVHSKIDRPAKLVMIGVRQGSRAMTEVLPPLIVFDAQSRYTEEATEAFVQAGTHSIKGDQAIDKEVTEDASS